jgi:AbiJ N-terminal domain 4
MGAPFSRRHGFREPSAIVIREDAPQGVRIGYLQIAHDEIGLTYNEIRTVVCGVLRTFPDENNWSEVPNIRDEVTGYIRDCVWYTIYDIIEATCRYLLPRELTGVFAERINHLLDEEGIGWQLINGQIVTRGPAEFEYAVAQAVGSAEEAGFQGARREIEEARHDLSRRPEPDITGTVQHCMAALECIARRVSGNEQATLGEIMNRHAAEIGIPRPLDNAIERMWGYASEVARHVREGRVPTREEAELLLSTSAAIITYLIQKNPNRNG